MKFEELEQGFYYVFKETDLLKHALSHKSSCGYEHLKSNERLEFLGDSVLQLSVSTYLYKNFPKMPEGKMAKLRAALVCQGTLAKIAEEIKLGDYIKLGKGEKLSCGAKKPSILSDAFEAVLGAIYMDSDFNKAQTCVLKIFEPVIHKFMEEEIDRDYKTKLQEYLQQDGNISIKYVTTDQQGMPHDMDFFVDVLCDAKVIGSGKGKSKKTAEQDAAKNALIKLEV